MRKVAIGTGIGIIIAFFLGTPYFFGKTNQSLNNELLTRANQMIQSKSEPLPPEEQNTIATFVVNEKIYHGPFYWGKDANGKTHFGFGRGYFVSMAKPDEETRQWLHSQGLQASHSSWENRTAEISLLGRIHATSEIPSLTYRNNGTALSWGGAKTKMMLSPGLSNLKANINIGALSYNQENTLLTIPSANISAKLRFKNGLWVGSSELQVPQIVTRRGGNAELSIANLLLGGNSNVSGSLLNSTITLAVDALQLGNTNYGPFSYNLDIRNVDANAWLRLRDLAAQYDALMDADALQYNLSLTHYRRGWFSSEAQMTFSISKAKPTGLIKRQLHSLARKSELLLVGNDISKTLPAIVNKGAQFNLQPTPAHPEPQMFQIGASLIFPKVLQAQDLGTLIEKAESHVKITFLADLINMVTSRQYPDKNSTDINTITQSLLNKWVASGYLSQNDSQYVFALDYSQGKLSINGKTMADATTAISNDVPGAVMPAATAASVVIPAAK